MSDNLVFEPSKQALERTRTTAAQYEEMYARSISDPNGFWREHSQRIDWIKPPTIIKNTTFEHPNVSIKWFEDGVLNISANCIDRHLPARADQTAIIWEGDTPGTDSRITYRQLYEHVCRFANVLKAQGVKKGDRVTIYMPMVPETAYAMLACARIGAVHSVIFGGFSPDSIAGRVNDCDSHIVITADEGRRGGKTIPLKKNVDEALLKAPRVSRVIVVQVTGNEVPMQAGRDVWYHDLAQGVSTECAPEPMNAEDPLFILYTSGSTGMPLGVFNTRGV
jgi:acetyl-CoA synthetase